MSSATWCRNYATWSYDIKLRKFKYLTAKFFGWAEDAWARPGGRWGKKRPTATLPAWPTCGRGPSCQTPPPVPVPGTFVATPAAGRSGSQGSDPGASDATACSRGGARDDGTARDFVYERKYDPLIAKRVGEVRPRPRPEPLPLRLTSWTAGRGVRPLLSGTGRSRPVPRRARAHRADVHVRHIELVPGGQGERPSRVSFACVGRSNRYGCYRSRPALERLPAGLQLLSELADPRLRDPDEAGHDDPLVPLGQQLGDLPLPSAGPQPRREVDPESRPRPPGRPGGRRPATPATSLPADRGDSRWSRG